MIYVANKSIGPKIFYKKRFVDLLEREKNGVAYLLECEKTRISDLLECGTG
jgi:hypothetical protein